MDNILIAKYKRNEVKPHLKNEAIYFENLEYRLYQQTCLYEQKLMHGGLREGSRGRGWGVGGRIQRIHVTL